MFVLASSSPRRQQLLSQLGYQFKSISPQVDESVINGENVDQYVSRVAKLKGECVFELNESKEKVIIASDTIVCIDDLILQKPDDFLQFQKNMRRLSDNWHQVKTAVFVRNKIKSQTITVCTNVKFRVLSEQEILKYWQTGEPIDKAGGYAIQGIGAGFVESIDGSYSNVVGLPLTQTIELLRQFDIDYLK
ncbi:MAG: septum formation inhibitor Maf [Saccharospirillaceae bacterium]|nr:Maf family protein [Pseudomonadales bacterium]NRB79850.1 septum formation inhibitor Maf [Saccharospirillaceae bacterium]